MKRQGFLMIVGMLVCTAIPLSAVDFKVTFLEGRLEFREKQGNWRQLGIGDIIPEDCSIRLSTHGFAEFTAGLKRVILTQAGTYNSSDLIEKVINRVSIRRIIGSKFSALIIRRSDDSRNVAAAVRGAELESNSFITWEDESANYLEDGLALMGADDFLGAREAFKKGSLWESGTIQRECVFRHGIIEQILGNPKVARSLLMALKPTEDDHFLGEYSVIMATMYIESMEYEQANKMLTNYLLTNPSDDAATQAAWLLSAYSLAQLGDDAGSRASLRKTIELDPRSEIGMSAANMLE